MSWRFEDGGPRRVQLADGGLHIGPDSAFTVTARPAPIVTMAVADEAGRLFLLRHTAGDGAVALVEQIDPVTLEPLATSVELAAGPVWPGGIGAHPNGSLYVVFGNHAHRLSPELHVLASVTLPRVAPYNSFVIVPSGHLVTKDFGGSRPGHLVAAEDREPCELLVLDPENLSIVARLVLPEPSIARLSADGDDIYVVGDTSLLRVRWDTAAHALVLDDGFTARYRTLEGQTYGWDCVIAAGAAWFLDNGDGSEGYTGTLRGNGISTAPLHLVRVDLATSAVTLTEICGLPGGLVANPPVVDEQRGVVVGYDSGNGVLVGFDLHTLAVRWRRDQDHGSHVVLYPGTGELVTADHTDVVILDIETGTELARAESGGGVQSVLFPTPGFDRDVYLCTFLAISRIAVTG